jgi:hypothetical protein
MNTPLLSYHGSCHCGAIGFTYQTRLPVAEWPVRLCQCTFCRAHGAQASSDPHGRLSFHVQHGELLERYRFGHRTADFLLCKQCGVFLGAQISAAQGAFGIINLLALQPLPAGLPGPKPMDYGAESADARVDRRVLRWTPLERLT